MKPYSFPELVARIDAVMRRTPTGCTTNRAIAHGTLLIDPVAHEVVVAEKTVRVTRKEFDLLYLLASQPKEVIGRQRIMSEVWADDSATAVGCRTIDTHVNTLRRKLGASDWIVTVRGVGFRMGRAAPLPVRLRQRRRVDGFTPGVESAAPGVHREAG